MPTCAKEGVHESAANESAANAAIESFVFISVEIIDALARRTIQSKPVP